MRKHLIDRLIERAREDSRIFLLIGDLGYSVVEKFQTEFPLNFENIGVSEQAGIGIAAGLAKTHLPIFYSIANFPSFRCLEQIRNDVAHEGNPVMIVSLGAGFSYGTAGYSHHAIEDAAAVSSIFGMTVVTPACVHELDQILEDHWASPKPTYLRLGSEESCETCLPNLDDYLSTSLSQGECPETLVVTHGEIGNLVASAIGTSGEVFRLLSVSDFSSTKTELFDFLAGHKRVITIEEHSKSFGFGARLRAELASTNFEDFKILGVPNLDFHVGGKRAFHLERAGLAPADFIRALEEARIA